MCYIFVHAMLYCPNQLNSRASTHNHSSCGMIIAMLAPKQLWQDQSSHGMTKAILTCLKHCIGLIDCHTSTQVRQSMCCLQALVSNNDDVHMLRCLLTASWHKLHGASWRPVIHSDVGRLHLASAQERVTATREGLQRYGDMTKAYA
jgi:hypothetical protein